MRKVEVSMNYNKGAILRAIEQPFLKTDLPEFDTGDTVRVDYRVSEGNRTRIQAFEGVVIARQNGKQGARSTFTVRKMSFRYRCRADFSAAFAADQRAHRRTPGPDAPRQALLSARPARQGCPPKDRRNPSGG